MVGMKMRFALLFTLMVGFFVAGCVGTPKSNIGGLISMDPVVRGRNVTKYERLAQQVKSGTVVPKNKELYLQIQQELETFLKESPHATQRTYAVRLVDNVDLLRKHVVLFDRSEKVRSLAIRRLHTLCEDRRLQERDFQHLLKEILKTDQSPAVRKVAIIYLYDRQALVDVAKTAKDYDVRFEAMKKVGAIKGHETIYGEIAMKAPRLKTREEAVAFISDNEILKAVYDANPGARYKDVRLAVLRRVHPDDHDFFSQCHKRETNIEIRQAIISKLFDLEVLNEIARTGKDVERAVAQRRQEEIIRELMQRPRPQSISEARNFAWIAQNTSYENRARNAAEKLAHYMRDLETQLETLKGEKAQAIAEQYQTLMTIFDALLKRDTTSYKVRAIAVGMVSDRDKLNAIIRDKSEPILIIEEARKRVDILDNRTLKAAEATIEDFEALLIIFDDELQDDEMKVRARNVFKEKCVEIINAGKPLEELLWIIHAPKALPQHRMDAIEKLASCELLRELSASKTLPSTIKKALLNRLEDCYCAMIQNEVLDEEEKRHLFRHWNYEECSRTDEIRKLIPQVKSRAVLKQIEGCDKFRKEAHHAREALDIRTLRRSETPYETVMTILKENSLSKEARQLAEDHQALIEVIEKGEDQYKLAEIVIYSTKNARSAIAKLTSIVEFMRVAYCREPMNGYLHREILLKTKNKRIKATTNTTIYRDLDIAKWSGDEEKTTQKNGFKFIYNVKDHSLRIEKK